MKSTARMEKRVDDPKLIEMAEAVASLVTLLKQPIRWFSAETHAQSLEKWCGDAVSRATVENSVKAHHDRPWYKRAWHWLWNTEGIRSQQDAWRCWQWISLFNPLLSWNKTDGFQIHSAFSTSALAKLDLGLLTQAKSIIIQVATQLESHRLEKITWVGWVKPAIKRLYESIQGYWMKIKNEKVTNMRNQQELDNAPARDEAISWMRAYKQCEEFLNQVDAGIGIKKAETVLNPSFIALNERTSGHQQYEQDEKEEKEPVVAMPRTVVTPSPILSIRPSVETTLSDQADKMLRDFAQIKERFLGVCLLSLEEKAIWEQCIQDVECLAKKDLLPLSTSENELFNYWRVPEITSAALSAISSQYIIWEQQKGFPLKIHDYAVVCGMLTGLQEDEKARENGDDRRAYHFSRIPIEEVRQTLMARFSWLETSFPVFANLTEELSKMSQFPQWSDLLDILKIIEGSYKALKWCEKALEKLPTFSNEWRQQVDSYRFDKKKIEGLYKHTVKIYKRHAAFFVGKQAGVMRLYANWKKWCEEREKAVVVYRPIHLLKKRIKLSRDDFIYNRDGRDYSYEDYLYFCGLFRVDPCAPNLSQLHAMSRRLKFRLHPDKLLDEFLYPKQHENLKEAAVKKMHALEKQREDFLKILEPEAEADKEVLKKYARYAEQDFNGWEQPFLGGVEAQEKLLNWVSQEIVFYKRQQNLAGKDVTEETLWKELEEKIDRFAKEWQENEEKYQADWQERQRQLAEFERSFQQQQEELRRKQEEYQREQEVRLKEQETKLKEQATRFKEQAAQQEAQLKEQAAQQEAQLKEQETKLKEQDTRFKEQAAQQEARLKEQETKLKEQETKLKEQNTRLKEQAARQEALEATVNALMAQLNQPKVAQATPAVHSTTSANASTAPQRLFARVGSGMSSPRMETTEPGPEEEKSSSANMSLS